MGYSKEQLLARLQELQIDFVSYSHPVVLTVEAQAKYVGHLGGELSKNLLLKDKKHRFYIVSALAGTKVDLKVLSQRLGLGKGGLRMAPEEALQELLQVPLGCVTPFALINESARTVSLLLDQGFKAQECCFFHPLSNDMTITKENVDGRQSLGVTVALAFLVAPALSSRDLDKFLISIGRQPSYVDLEATPLVGKDQPPDLAALVPSGVTVLPNPAEKAVPSQIPIDNRVTVDTKSAELTGKSVGQSENSQGTEEKLKAASDPLVAVTDVRKFVDELIQKTSEVVLSEIQHGEQLRPVVLDGVRKRLSADLENLTTMFKNAAYTQGFCAGVRSLPSSKCPPPSKF